MGRIHIRDLQTLVDTGGLAVTGGQTLIASSNADTLEDCHCHSSESSTFSSTFVLKPASPSPSPLNTFDDSGRYYVRSYFAFSLPKDLP
jgi:hypothetical protein